MDEREDNLDDDSMEMLAMLYEENYDKMIGYALRVTDSMASAEDVVQDTFYEAVKKAEQLSNHPNPTGWLIETMKNKLRATRRRALRQMYNIDDCEVELARLESQYRMVELFSVMESVFDKHEQELFQLYYVKGYSAREIAGMENINENSFRVKMHRLKNRLLKEIKGISSAILLIGLCWMRFMAR